MWEKNRACFKKAVAVSTGWRIGHILKGNGNNTEIIKADMNG